MTQAETELPRSATPPPKSLIDKPDEPAGADAKPAINVAETMPADEELEQQAARRRLLARPATTVAQAAVAAASPQRVHHRRRRPRPPAARARPLVDARSLAPLVTLALALAALAGLGLYLSRPSTADELYAKISSHIAADDVEAMREVEREIIDFVARFPDDDAHAELREHQQRLELDKMHRQLHRHRGGIADPDAAARRSALPQSDEHRRSRRPKPRSACSSPDQACMARRDQSADTDDRRAMCVQLAERQLVQLREDASPSSHERQLAAIHERLAAADQLAKTHPDEARQIYQAIIELYGNRTMGGRRRRRGEAKTRRTNRANDETAKKATPSSPAPKQLMPGGVNSPARAFGAVGGEPIVIDRGEGAYLWDVDGNRYIDYVGSGAR